MRILNLVFVLALSSCANSFLKYEKQDKFFKNEEFEREVKIKTEDEVQPVSGTIKLVEKQAKKVVVKKQPVIVKAKKANSKTPEAAAPLKRQPEIEDSEGFTGSSRRPNIDPFKVGEKVIHEVSYFAAKAGILTMQVKPFAQVNNRKSYNFMVDLKSSSMFSSFYSVEDNVNTFLDYETLMPHVLKINIKETGKLAQSQSYFNNETLMANFWEKKYTEKAGEEERKFSWDILPYSQNAFSGLFYMRVFNWKEDKVISFRVAEDKKNIIFTGTAIAKEKLSTDAGDFNAIKIKASIVTRGALSQTGDIFLWVSDDEHKYILRIEAKIKIGTLVSEVIEIVPGS